MRFVCLVSCSAVRGARKGYKFFQCIRSAVPSTTCSKWCLERHANYHFRSGFGGCGSGVQGLVRLSVAYLLTCLLAYLLACLLACLLVCFFACLVYGGDPGHGKCYSCWNITGNHHVETSTLALPSGLDPSPSAFACPPSMSHGKS